jgi:hypothetical protein
MKRLNGLNDTRAEHSLFTIETSKVNSTVIALMELFAFSLRLFALITGQFLPRATNRRFCQLVELAEQKNCSGQKQDQQSEIIIWFR